MLDKERAGRVFARKWVIRAEKCTFLVNWQSDNRKIAGGLRCLWDCAGDLSGAGVPRCARNDTLKTRARATATHLTLRQMWGTSANQRQEQRQSQSPHPNQKKVRMGHPEVYLFCEHRPGHSPRARATAPLNEKRVEWGTRSTSIAPLASTSASRPHECNRGQPRNPLCAFWGRLI